MIMFRKIIVPRENTYLLKLPDEMVGKEIEIIAFKTNKNEMTAKNSESDIRTRYRNAIAYFKKHAVDFSSIKKWTREDLYD